MIQFTYRAATRLRKCHRRLIATCVIHDISPAVALHGGGAARVIEPAPVIDHTDEELILMESMVGRVPPFGSTPSDDY